MKVDIILAWLVQCAYGSYRPASPFHMLSFLNTTYSEQGHGTVRGEVSLHLNGNTICGADSSLNPQAQIRFLLQAEEARRVTIYNDLTLLVSMC